MKKTVVFMTLSVAFLAAFPNPVLAQNGAASSSSSSGSAGVDGPILRKALEAYAQGECAADMLGPQLLDACQQQISVLKSMIGSKGHITDLEFLGSKAIPGGQAEMYRVTYEHGSQIWGIAMGPDGKVAGMGTHDQ